MIDANGFFIVDVPMRLTAAELERLESASSNARPEPTGRQPFADLEGKLAVARDRALEILELRKRREAAFGADLFGEPAWDILLDLFIQYVDRQKTSSTSAAVAARVPATTALRHLNSLIRRGLLVRHTSDHDLRLQYVGLTESGYLGMLDLLSGDTR